MIAMITKYWTRYVPGYLKTLLYMLQNTEYKIGDYLRWYFRTSDFRRVMKRRGLDMTSKVKLLLVVLRLLTLVFIIVVGLFVYNFYLTGYWGWLLAAVLVALSAPKLLAGIIIIPLVIGDILIQKPRERAIIRRAKGILNDHPAVRVAIAGSYGKTTAKEMLLAVLKQAKSVAATPGNMNTAIGISRFVQKLNGDEDILIFELGEERMGDVAQLSRLTVPDIGVITGIAEAHLSSFKTIERTAATIFELADFVTPDKLYTNQDNSLVAKYPSKSTGYSYKGLGDWKVSKVSTSVGGTDFTAKNGSRIVRVHTGLLGIHNIGPTLMAIAIADSLGLTTKEIERGLRTVVPFEHRMEPRPMHGAWIIDDTYNGNSEGVKAGLEFLKDSGAKRRVYVTPGLVEQGSMTETVHREMGRQIATSADVVVLMENSVTEYIKAGMKKAGFKGKLVEVDNPLEFYTNLDQFVASGDIVLMQNDWTDNYQ
ncbi:MAG: UDP-N-acetylmuramoyl-tripeptide--D-alanyl-D-alanine ligase [Candidatus Microsaccharimonas sp.]